MTIDVSKLSPEELADLEQRIDERRQKLPEEILKHVSDADQLMPHAAFNDDLRASLAKTLERLVKEACQSPEAAQLLREAIPQEKTRTPRRSPQDRAKAFSAILSKIGKGTSFTSKDFRRYCSDSTDLETFVAADNPLSYFAAELKEAKDAGRIKSEGELSKTVYTVEEI